MSLRDQEIVFLRGERVVLRPLEKSDLPWCTKWINDPEVRRYLTAYLPMTLEDEESWHENLRSNKSSDLVLVIVVDGKPIGLSGIHKIHWKDRTCSTGALIGEKEFWSKGYGTEAKLLTLEYVFNTLNLRKVNSSVYPFNERSLAYLKKCGYREEGRLIKQYFVEGKYHDAILMAVFRTDWEEAQKNIRESS